MSKIFYRVASLVEPLTEETQTSLWKWRSTILTSSHALYTLLKTYQHLPKGHILVFFGSSEADMEEMLVKQNEGKVTTSFPAEHVLSTKKVNQQDVRRLAFELSTEDDHDTPYTFELPLSWHERQAWVSLLQKVRQGELIS
jgi:hypothetical protein